jgi:hypothetical protein
VRLPASHTAELAELLEDRHHRQLLAAQVLGEAVPEHQVLEGRLCLSELRSDVLMSFIREKMRSHSEGKDVYVRRAARTARSEYFFSIKIIFFISWYFSEIQSPVVLIPRPGMRSRTIPIRPYDCRGM